jgi:hypothetical protein
METFLKESCDIFFSKFCDSGKEKNLHESLNAFCENPKKETAERVYVEFLRVYGLEGLKELVTAMEKFEVNSSPLLSKHRDHYVHTLYVFLIGLSIFARNKGIRAIALNNLKYPDQRDPIGGEFLYRWGIASLFHDVGYPLEIAYGTLQEFMDIFVCPSLSFKDGKTIQVSEKREHSKKPSVILNFPKLENLCYINRLKPPRSEESQFYKLYPHLQEAPNDILCAISERISHIGFANAQTINNALKASLIEGLESGELDHGIYSAIILLKWTNDAYSKSKWNPAHYYISMIDSATAILLHNAYRYLFQKSPFDLGPLSAEANLLGFLLIICDNVQETNRKCYGYEENGIKYTGCKLHIDDKELHVKLFIHKNEDLQFARRQIQDKENSIRKLVDVNPVFEQFSIKVDPEI